MQRTQVDGGGTGCPRGQGIGVLSLIRFFSAQFSRAFCFIRLFYDPVPVCLSLVSVNHHSSFRVACGHLFYFAPIRCYFTLTCCFFFLLHTHLVLYVGLSIYNHYPFVLLSFPLRGHAEVVKYNDVDVGFALVRLLRSEERLTRTRQES